MENEINYKLIGSRIRAIRKKRKLTQEELAERAGISAQHCSGIETGAAKVSLPALLRIANSLDVTPDEILLDSVKQSAPLYAEKISEVFSDCSAEELFLILSQAENLKKALRIKANFSTIV